MTICVFFVITFLSLGNTDRSGFKIIYKDNRLPELCGLLCEEYIVWFVILTVDINVSTSLARTMHYFIYNVTSKDHGELLTSKSSASTQGGCSFVFSVFDAFLTTLFPVEKKIK